MRFSRLFFILSALFFIGACKQAPTRVQEESSNNYKKNVVLVDTRPAFEFATYHVAGSVNLNSENFLILKNSKTKTRVFDPDLNQTIERLAKRGISPLKSVFLISDKADSVENKKWNWLLQQLDVKNISMMTIEDYHKMNKNLIPQADPEAMPMWEVRNQMTILKKADLCFIKWTELDCRNI